MSKYIITRCHKHCEEKDQRARTENSKGGPSFGWCGQGSCHLQGKEGPAQGTRGTGRLFLAEGGAHQTPRQE